MYLFYEVLLKDDQSVLNYDLKDYLERSTTTSQSN